MKTLVIMLFLAVLTVAPPASSQAEQYQSGTHVVHTNLLPVIVHRISPPFRGVHIYQGRNNRR